MATAFRMLILSGTGTALALAARLAGMPGIAVLSSFAGRVRERAVPPGDVRVGGFGGVDGLSTFLREHSIDAVIDATHPFAATIARNAAEACAAMRVPLLALARAPWTARSGDRWYDVDNVAEAAAVAPLHGTRIFLTIGRQELAPFASCKRPWFLIRTIEPPMVPLPPNHTLIFDRGPFALEREMALLRDYAIDVLVSKNSGGTATIAKLDAARELGVPVVMVRRPLRPPVPSVETIDEAVAWVSAQHLAGAAHT